MIRSVSVDWLSLGAVLLLWSGCALGLLFSLRQACRRVTLARVRRLAVEEEGAGYTIAYLMTLPIYILFIGFFFELSLILICSAGAIHAAFAGARAAVVWDSENNPTRVDQLVSQVAARAYVPFASGLTELRSSRNATASADETKYVAAYRNYRQQVQSNEAGLRYVGAKFRYAQRKLRTQIVRKPGESGKPWDKDISVTVSYEYPFGMLGVGRVIGKVGEEGLFVHPITATVTLKSELPMNDETKLGVDYARLP